MVKPVPFTPSQFEANYICLQEIKLYICILSCTMIPVLFKMCICFCVCIILTLTVLIYLWILNDAYFFAFFQCLEFSTMNVYYFYNLKTTVTWCFTQN